MFLDETGLMLQPLVRRTWAPSGRTRKDWAEEIRALLDVDYPEAEHWYARRNADQKSVDWQFITETARIKLKRLYPQIQMA